MDSKVLEFSVPMFRTRAEAMEAISSISSFASAMTGEPPQQMQAFAQSLTVT